MYKKPLYIDIKEIRSHWYDNIQEEWHSNPVHIDYLKQKIKKKEYLPAIVLVREANGYVIVNGHHRFYAHIVAGEKHIKAFVLDGTFEDTEPLRKAEVLLKKYDEKINYKYQFSGYLDRWAAAAENHVFINKYRPIYRVDIYSGLKRFIKDISHRLFKRQITGDKSGRYQENSGKY